MAHPGIGFFILLGAGIVAAVGLFFAANLNQQYTHNTNGNTSPPSPSNSWNNSDEKKNCRRRRKSITEKSCSICLSNDNSCDFKLNCGHIFHLDCLVKWVELQKTCPNCRSSLDDTFLN